MLTGAMPSRAPSIRYACYYGAVFLALGVYLPFWPVWLAHRGLAATDIGLLLALTAWVKVLAVPPVARLSDWSGRPKAVLVLLSGASLAIFATFLLARDFWAILTVQLMTALAFHALIPLAESRTMRAVRTEGLDYGRIRLWGSLAFILGALGAGELLTGRSPDLLLWLILGALAATAAAALLLPGGAPTESKAAAPGGLGRLLADRRFLLFLVAAGLLQASHAVYYGFSALTWRAGGLSEATVGWLWAEGVIAEVAFFAASTWVLRHCGPATLLALAGLAGVLRWTVLAGTAALPVLILVQALHALSFGAAHLAAVHFIAGRAPAGLAATAQGLYAALSGGLAMGLATLLAGRLYERLAAESYLAMAVLSLAGLALALILRRAEASDRRSPSP